MIRILLADDHELFRAPLKRMIDSDPNMNVVGEASRGPEVLDVARRTSPDLVLLDVKMPGRGCEEVVAELREWRSALRILIVTSTEDWEYALRLVRAGISGYITKDASPDRLLQAIGNVSKGRDDFPQDLQAMLLQRFRSGDSGHPHEKLSKREYQVFIRLAEARTVSEVADELNLSVKTISTYRTRVLDKLSLRNNAEIMRYALQHGLIQLDDPDGGDGAGDDESR